MRGSTIALAMAMGLSLTVATLVAAPADFAPSTRPGVDALVSPAAGSSSAAPALPESATPPVAGLTDRPDDRLTLTRDPGAVPLPAPTQLPKPLSQDDTLAPLPSAVVAGPVSLLLAGWMARRANRRGGRV